MVSYIQYQQEILGQAFLKNVILKALYLVIDKFIGDPTTTTTN